jgi:hypothetical protein
LKIIFIDKKKIEENDLIDLDGFDKVIVSSDTTYDSAKFKTIVMTESHRSLMYREFYWKWFDEIISKNTKFENILEAFRFSLYFDLDEIVYKYWVIQHLINNFKPTQLKFITDLNGLHYSSNQLNNFSTYINGCQILFRSNISKNRRFLFLDYIKSIILIDVSFIRSIFNKKHFKFKSQQFGKTVLFAERNPRTVGVVLDVMHELTDKVDEIFCLSFSQNVTNYFIKNIYNKKIKIIEAVQFLFFSDLIKSNYQTLKFSFNYNQTESGNYKTIYEILIKSDVSFQINLKFKESYIYDIVCDRALRKIKPRVTVFMSNVSNYARSICLLNRKSKIGKTYLIQHGLYSKNDDLYYLADEHFLWGEAFAIDQQKVGVSKNQQHLVGNSKIYDAINNKSNIKPIVKQWHKVNILYLAPRTGGANVSVSSSIKFVNMLKQLSYNFKSEINIFIKVHPTDNYLYIFDDFEFSLSGDVFEYIKNADIIITAGISTSALEAFSYNKIVYIINDDEMDTSFEDFGLNEIGIINNENELIEEVSKILKNPSETKFYKDNSKINKFFLEPNTNPTQLMSNLIFENFK